jgi:hypothetical protein
MTGTKILAKNTRIDYLEYHCLLRRSESMNLLEVELQIIWFHEGGDA